MDPNAATVDMFEFFGALDKYRLLEDKVRLRPKWMSRGCRIQIAVAKAECHCAKKALSRKHACRQMSHERVQSLKAVSKKDATSIFKKCGQTDEGKSVSRLTQVPCSSLADEFSPCDLFSTHRE